MCLPDVCLRADCTAGRHGRIIFRCACAFSVFVSDMVFATGCIGRMILRVYIVSVHLSPTWCLLLDALAGSVSSSMLSFLDIYICLLRAVSCWVPWTNHFAVGVLGFARGVSSWMSWLHDFAICVFSFSFIDLPNYVFCFIVVLHFLAKYVCTVAFCFLYLRPV